MEALLVGSALLPAFIVMFYIYKKDKVEKEPKGLIVCLMLLGALMIIVAGLIEVGLCKVLAENLAEDSTEYIFIENFFIIALAEEGCKMLVLRLRTWRNPNFNYTFDAVVYAVAVSLGFAALENVLYVVSKYSFGLALMRGILSVPGHAIDAVFMGYYYGLAKRGECMGDKRAKNHNMRMALIVPVATHGFYDFCLTMNDDVFLGLFFAFEVFITGYAIRKVRKLSKEDSPLIPSLGVPFASYGQYMNAQSAPYGYAQYVGGQQGYPQQQYQQYNNGAQQGYPQQQYPQYNNGAQQGYPQQQYQQYNNGAQQDYDQFGQDDYTYTQQLIDEELKRSGFDV